jgi:hypothetical protein
VEQRIEWLTRHKLQRLANDFSGWNILFRDLRDGRLWELTFPQSEMHGGGPKRLHVISADEASARYSHAVI